MRAPQTRKFWTEVETEALIRYIGEKGISWSKILIEDLEGVKNGAGDIIKPGDKIFQARCCKGGSYADMSLQSRSHAQLTLRDRAQNIKVDWLRYMIPFCVANLLTIMPF